MIGQTIGHYRVLAEIGGGGMGVVYRAQDVRLGREVALKVLPPDLESSPEARARFRREAELVASLNHPHICTLHDVGEHEGRWYLVFELVEGRTLRDTIDGAPLSPARAIAVGVDVAEALDAAHARGIVHRDVKPGNIMLTASDAVKLLDFGIARREWATAAHDETTAGEVTRQGSWVGTPDYVAPEQLRGETVDARADVFALGAVMYEMVTGRPPFRADTIAGTTEAVLHREPARPSTLCAHVTTDLERVILKALEKDRTLRYQTSREIVADLRRLARDSSRSTAPSAAGAAAARRSPRAAIIATAALAVVAGGIWIWLVVAGRSEPSPPVSAGAAGPHRLVVLPFENQTGQADVNWVGSAFSDAISAALQPVASLILVPRERIVELYAAESRSESAALSAELARQVSQKLRVRYYVHGSYQKVGDQLRVIARLVDVESDRVQSQATDTGPVTNVLAMEDKLASQLAVALGASSALLRVGQTSHVDALRLFTEAGGLYARTQFLEARARLEQALTMDRQFAAAWALLSKVDSHLVAPANVGRERGLASLQTALEAAREAVRLAPDLADAHVALAMAHRNLNQRELMRSAAEQAARLAPRSAEAVMLVGNVFSISPGLSCPTGFQPDVAEARYREAIALEPAFPLPYHALTTLVWWRGRFVEAAAVLDQGLAVQSNRRLQDWLPFNYLFAGRIDEAEALLQRAERAGPLEPRDVFIQGLVALKRGRFPQADALLTKVSGFVDSTVAFTLITAVAQFQADRPAEGARYLGRALKGDPSCRDWATKVPALEPYRNLPEFKKVVAF